MKDSSDQEEGDSEAKPKKKKIERTVQKQTVERQKLDKRKTSPEVRKKQTGQRGRKLPSKDSLDSKHADVVEEFHLWSDED